MYYADKNGLRIQSCLNYLPWLFNMFAER